MTTKTKNKTPSRKTCLKCDKSFPLSGYYSTSDTDYYADSKLPVCKICCQKNIDEKGFDGFQDLLRLLNKPLYEDLFDGDFYEYVKNINSLPQYRKTSFLESTLFNENKAMSNIKRAKPTELSENELRENEDFWGRGYSEEEYIYLSMEYEDYLNRYEVDSKTMENLIREICLVQLDIRSARTQKKDVKNELKAYNDLLTAANLKPVQETGAQASDQETYGTWIKKLENERPVSDPDPVWKDVDGIGKSIRTYFLGNMLKAFGKENTYQDEYTEEMGKYTVESRRDGED